MSQEPIQATKRCCRCQEKKSIDEFFNAKDSVDGKQRKCKSCKKEDAKLEWQKLKGQEEKHRELLERRRGYQERRAVAAKLQNQSDDSLDPGMKRCIWCHEVKVLDEFHRYKSSPDGKRSECKLCGNAYSKARYQRDREKIRERRAEVCVNSRQRSTSPVKYRAIFAAQKNVCAICGQAETVMNRHGKVNNLAIDHDHKTGKVRGLLCFNCNTALGRFKDDPELLERAIAYLVGSSLNVAG